MNTVRSFLPSKTVTAFLIVPACALFLWWVINTLFLEESVPQVSVEQRLAQTLEEQQNAYNKRDTDGDGLKDWEEFIAGTDFESRDTDGDGATDYEESIRTDRDPLNPQDPLFENSASSSTTTVPFYTEDPNLTQTEVFARDIFATFVQLQQADGFGSNLQDTLVRQVSADVISRDNREAPYTKDTIRIIPEPTRNQIKTYKSQYDVAASLLDPVTTNSLALLYDYANSNSATHHERIKGNLQAYQKYTQALENIAVPDTAADIHIELLNNLYFHNETLSRMTKIADDPLGAFLAASSYISDEELLGISFDALDLYFERF